MRRQKPPSPAVDDHASSKGVHRGLFVILGAFLLLGGIYSLITPLFEAPDELYHYPLVKRLADGQGLPVQSPGQIGPWQQEGGQPPLYYGLAALLTRGINTGDLDAVRRLNPHADIGVIKRDRNANMVLHPPDRPLWGETPWPFRGAVLAVYLVRWMSLLLGAIAVLATYLLAREFAPQDSILALSASCLTAFNAMFLFITSSVNNDALVIPLCLLTLWLLLRSVARRPGARQWLLLGVLLGLGVLSKLSALGLLALAAGTLCLVSWRQRSWRPLLVGALWIGLCVLLLTGWWFYRNWRLYGDPLGLSAFVAVVGKRYPVPTLAQLWGERHGFVKSFWGLLGGLNVPAPTWAYRLWNLMALLGFLGIPLYIYRAVRAGHWTSTQSWQQAMLIAWPLILLLSLVRWTLMTPASQGRLLFPGIGAISLLLAMGLQGWLPWRYRAILPAAASALMLGIAAILPFGTIRPAYQSPQRLTVAEVGEIERLDVTFGERARLLGYELAPSSAAPGDEIPLTLYWEALAPMTEDYSVFVHLVDGDGFIVGQRDMYPGQGTYPTSYWQPGEVIADSYMVPLSPTALTPQKLHLAVGLYRYSTGERLAPQGSNDASAGHTSSYRLADSAIHFGHITLPSQRMPEGLQPISFVLEKGIALSGYALDRRVAAPGETITLTLRWRALRDIDENYSVFTHIFQGGQIWAQKDKWPLDGDLPTALWHKGQVVDDTYALTFKPDTPAGVYPLQVGMTDGEGERLTVLGETGYAADMRILLGEVRVVPGDW